VSLSCASLACAGSTSRSERSDGSQHATQSRESRTAGDQASARTFKDITDDRDDLGEPDGQPCERKCANGIIASFNSTKLNPSSLAYDTCGVFTMRLQSESGMVLQDIPIQRKSRRVSHLSPYPDGIDIVVSEAAHRIIFRVAESLSNSGGESWWLFDENTAGLICIDLPLDVWSDGYDLCLTAHGVFALRDTPFVVASFLSSKGCRGDQSLDVADRVAVFDVKDRAHAVWTSATDGANALNCGVLVAGEDGRSFEWNGRDGTHLAWTVSSAGSVTPLKSK
jgi:hypothetical protein